MSVFKGSLFCGRKEAQVDQNTEYPTKYQTAQGQRKLQTVLESCKDLLENNLSSSSLAGKDLRSPNSPWVSYFLFDEEGKSCGILREKVYVKSVSGCAIPTGSTEAVTFFSDTAEGKFSKNKMVPFRQLSNRAQERLSRRSSSGSTFSTKSNQSTDDKQTTGDARDEPTGEAMSTAHSGETESSEDANNNGEAKASTEIIMNKKESEGKVSTSCQYVGCEKGSNLTPVTLQELAISWMERRGQNFMKSFAGFDLSACTNLRLFNRPFLAEGDSVLVMCQTEEGQTKELRALIQYFLGEVIKSQFDNCQINFSWESNLDKKIKGILKKQSKTKKSVDWSQQVTRMLKLAVAFSHEPADIIGCHGGSLLRQLASVISAETQDIFILKHSIDEDSGFAVNGGGYQKDG